MREHQVVEEVWVQRIGGELADETTFAAFSGFLARDFKVKSYEWLDLLNGLIPLTRTSLLVGGVDSVRLALKYIGCIAPSPLNIPGQLEQFSGRLIQHLTVREIRASFAEDRSPLFIKPATVTKQFPAQIVGSLHELDLLDFSDNVELFTSDLVSFVSEWRFFVLRSSILGVSYYTGNWSNYPDVRVVQSAVEAYHSTAPVAYALDFGVTDDGRSLLVEVNDAWALSSYGLSSCFYSELLEARWIEMMNNFDS